MRGPAACDKDSKVDSTGKCGVHDSTSDEYDAKIDLDSIDTVEDDDCDATEKS